nr:hypothetical protein [uncultured Rhodopila sp.]
MRIPVLTTPGLLLRGFDAGDWDACAEMNADPAVRQWLGGALRAARFRAGVWVHPRPKSGVVV